MNTQNKLILFAFAGLLAGFGIGYIAGIKNKEPRFLYEWEEEEDYGDEADDYNVGDGIIENELEENNNWDTNYDSSLSMKAEPKSIK